MKGIPAWLGGRKVYILGFTGGLENISANTFGHTIFAVYYDPDKTSGALDYCTIDCLSLDLDEWKK